MRRMIGGLLALAGGVLLLVSIVGLPGAARAQREFDPAQYPPFPGQDRTPVLFPTPFFGLTPFRVPTLFPTVVVFPTSTTAPTATWTPIPLPTWTLTPIPSETPTPTATAIATPTETVPGGADIGTPPAAGPDAVPTPVDPGS